MRRPAFKATVLALIFVIAVASSSTVADQPTLVGRDVAPRGSILYVQPTKRQQQLREFAELESSYR